MKGICGETAIIEDIYKPSCKMCIQQFPSQLDQSVTSFQPPRITKIHNVTELRDEESRAQEEGKQKSCA